MATNNSLKQQMTQTPTDVKQKQTQTGIKGLLNNPTIKQKFEDVLKDKAPAFTSSVLSLVNNDTYLAQSDPMSILTCAMTAATLDLPLDKNLGYAYIVPFKDKKQDDKQIGQFVLGYKGYIQLAQRSGQYKALNVVPVYEGELEKWNRLTEEFILNSENKKSDVVIGYVGYFELLNGFKKTVYWTKEEVEAHRRKHAKGRDKSPTGVWRDDFDTMACKTVLRHLLSKWGILSIAMQTAERYDEQALSDIDAESGDIKIVSPIEEETTQVIETTDSGYTVDTETGEIVAEQETLLDEITTQIKE